MMSHFLGEIFEISCINYMKMSKIEGGEVVTPMFHMTSFMDDPFFLPFFSKTVLKDMKNYLKNCR